MKENNSDSALESEVLRGAVAQLGERVNGIHEVEGSIPFSSTILVIG